EGLLHSAGCFLHHSLWMGTGPTGKRFHIWPVAPMEVKEATKRPLIADAKRAAGRGLPTSEHRILLRTGDLLVSVTAVAVALSMWSITAGFPLSFQFLVLHRFWFLAALLWCLTIAPARHPGVAFSSLQTSRAILQAAFIFLMMYLAVYFFASRQALPRLMV